jgi:glycosyltransferase involved in cell wall biosynthesis
MKPPMMSTPDVSVVMSVFNGQAYLAEAIESILNQSYRDFDFVIIDDGSTDKTAEILRSYASRDQRIRIYRHENKGRAASLNIGIELAKGNYVARMDADDFALPHRLQEQVRFMNEHPEVGLIGGAFELINNNQVLKTIRFPAEDSEVRSMMGFCNPICHPTVLMRKEVALASGGYRKALLDADDYDLWLRMSERTKLGNLDAVVLRYRVHASQVSLGNMAHQKLCVLAARAAAVSRRRGDADPLSGVTEITRELVRAMGVTVEEVEQSVLGGYRYWMELLGTRDPEAALRVINEFLRSANSPSFERAVLADAWLKAAGLHYRQGRPMSALVCGARGVMIRPIVAGRPMKRAFLRLAAALKG